MRSVCMCMCSAECVPAHSLSYMRTTHGSGWETHWMKAFGLDCNSLLLVQVTSTSVTLPEVS